MTNKIKISNLDRLFSLIVRHEANGTCERCLRKRRLECSHFHGRRKKSTRWHFWNVASLCRYCHQFFTENPEAHRQFFFKRLGQEKYDVLNLLANTGRRPDEFLLEIAFKRMAEERGLK